MPATWRGGVEDELESQQRRREAVARTGSRRLQVQKRATPPQRDRQSIKNRNKSGVAAPQNAKTREGGPKQPYSRGQRHCGQLAADYAA